MARKATVSVDSMTDNGIQLKAPEEKDPGMNIVLTYEEVRRIREGMGEFIRDLYFLRLRNPLLVDALLGWVFQSGNVTKIAAWSLFEVLLRRKERKDEKTSINTENQGSHAYTGCG